MRALRLPALLAVALVSWGHVGSPTLFYEGEAGPYPVRVIVRPPEVIPGIAEVTLRSKAGRIDRVTAQPVHWEAGEAGSRPPDEARPVAGEPGLWSAQLWMMTTGAYNIRVRVAGPRGEGEVAVPVSAAPTRLLPMGRGMGTVLALLGAVLFLGMVSLAGAAVREGGLEPGQRPDSRRRARAWRVMASTALLLGLALWGGKRWWDGVAAEHQARLDRPYSVQAEVRPLPRDKGGTGRTLEMRVDDPRWNDAGWSPLIPDHGKLMHLFLVREPGLDAFAHLHPEPVGAAEEGRFRAALPNVPAGNYRLYGDVTHESGFTRTLVAKVSVPPPPGGAPAVADAAGPAPTDAAGPAATADDSWAMAPFDCGTVPGQKAMSDLGDGFMMVWDRDPEPFAAGRETTLRFAVHGPDGKAAALEPYMGMTGHAVVSRDDGEVFVHLHPMGNVSAVARHAYEEGRERPSRPSRPAAPASSGLTAPAAMPDDHVMPQGPGAAVSFPYEFPRPGAYRVWVQVKTGGAVRTGTFDVDVT